METLNMTAARDQKQFYKLLDNLISTNKEFQIMITVPSGTKEGDRSGAHTVYDKRFGKGCNGYDP